MPSVFKFGGASVKDAAAVDNVVAIIRRYSQHPLVVVISAMDKTTNALEGILSSYWDGDAACSAQIEQLKGVHLKVVHDLFGSGETGIYREVEDLFGVLASTCAVPPSANFNFEYDRIVSWGEIIATKIVQAYLLHKGIAAAWLDAREVIATDGKWREAKVDWAVTEERIAKETRRLFQSGQEVIVSQGFIGGTAKGQTTTIGREGSDFSAAIFGYVLNADGVTIWKDVPGMLNADPKWFDNTVLLKKISFREAIELAYFGASILHPRTIQPLKKKNIPLRIKSFVEPSAPGSLIQSSEAQDAAVPSFIFKVDQVLISLSPRDFSFVVEEHLEAIFSYLNKVGIRMHLMQNSAISFSFCADSMDVDARAFFHHFEPDYHVLFTEGVELVTIRHYDAATIQRVTVGKRILLEQRSRQTARMAMLNA